MVVNWIFSSRSCLRIRSLSREVHVINAQFVVKPLGLAFDKLRGKEALGFNLIHNSAQGLDAGSCETVIIMCLLLHLLSLALKFGSFIARTLLAQDAGMI